MCVKVLFFRSIADGYGYVDMTKEGIEVAWAC